MRLPFVPVLFYNAVMTSRTPIPTVAEIYVGLMASQSDPELYHKLEEPIRLLEPHGAEDEPAPDNLLSFPKRP